MATIKYKNGSTWTALSLGGAIGTLNQEYPVGSFYIGAISCYGNYYTSTSNQYTFYTYDVKSDLSPASKYGGTWVEYKYNTNTLGILVNPSHFYADDNGRYMGITNVSQAAASTSSYTFGTQNVGGYSFGSLNSSAQSFSELKNNYSSFFNSLYWVKASLPPDTNSDGKRAYYNFPIFIARLWQRTA